MAGTVTGDVTAAPGRLVRRLRERQELQFFGVLPKAHLGLTVAWWAVLLLRGLLPAVFAIAMGALVGAVQRGGGLAAPLLAVGVVFVLLQVLVPVHLAVSLNLGDRTAAWLYDRLTAACVGPPGMGHLEDPALAADLTAARDFDLGMTGPPLSIAMDFIASGLVELVGGLAAAVVLAALAAPVAAAVRARRHPLVPAALGAYAAFLVHAAIDWDWEMPALTLVAVVLAGVLVARSQAA
jgi:hypothetical protein